MEPFPENFSYAALNTQKHEIRLIHLQPRVESDTIKCIITTANLDDQPSFEALSYEWGSLESERRQITANERQIQIRENLWAALYHLREDSQPRTLWVDALCINQDDTRERNHQVGQMDKIYSQATRVVAWVGREESQDKDIYLDEGGVAIAFLHELSSRSVAEFPYREDKPGPLSIALTPHTVKWDALATFCKRRYWSRLWIIQEIVLASKIMVQYGALCIPCEAFSNLWQQLRVPRPKLRFQNGLQNITSSVPFKLETMRKDRRWAIDNTGCRQVFTSLLVDLLVQFKDSDCEDIKDKVFGVLSLTRECCRKAMPADYSMERIDIGARLLEHHLTHHGKSGFKGAMAVCQKVLKALGMVFGPDQEPAPFAVDRSLRSIGLDSKLSIDTISAGRIEWISSLFGDLQKFCPSKLLTNKFRCFRASEHYCSRKPDLLSTVVTSEIFARYYRKPDRGWACGAQVMTRLTKRNRWQQYNLPSLVKTTNEDT